jgi:CRISPR-associated endonuclease/helicase Cas3
VEVLVFLAHSSISEGKNHSLISHLSETANRARTFANEFGAGDIGYLAGLWHDLGKFSEEFQEYINRPIPPHGPDHSSAGAVFANSTGLYPLAYLIAGHHGGLPSYQDLKERIQRKQDTLESVLRQVSGTSITLEPSTILGFPAFVQKGSYETQEFFLRMLFSALVDADFLDTERYFYPEASLARGAVIPLDKLLAKFAEKQDRLSGTQSDTVNQIRHQVYLKCIHAASEPPGLFRLIAPTGSGKTRSSMAFALHHAFKHGMNRIIVAIPYTSIIDQSAEVYREIFGEEAVLEHHSGIEWPDTDRNGFITPSTQVVRARLASQNWDSPIVVTTTVQLFDSLFSNRPSRCRKLHNLTRSVLILDEVQMLPQGLLGPILDVIQDLGTNYGTSVVLCSATPPDFQQAAYMSKLVGVREVIREPLPLFNALRRVGYEVHIRERWSWEEVAEEMRGTSQCMAVLNTRNNSLALMKALGVPDALHLSTLLCSAHRMAVLREVRHRLEAGIACRLVSTQVVEAGVDLDFPVVFRAVGPLDRIVQAAGRCNREGKLDRLGRVIVFQPESRDTPPGEYRTGTEIAVALLRDEADLHDPSTHQAYFRKLAGSVDQDAKEIQERRRALDYPEVAKRFRLIDDDGIPVVVPYPSVGAVAPLLAKAQRPDTNLRELLRRLQPHLVSLRERQAQSLQEKGVIREVIQGLWQWVGTYDPIVGIGSELADPERFVI